MGQCIYKERYELCKKLSTYYSNCQMNEFDNLSVEQLRARLYEKIQEDRQRKQNEAFFKQQNLIEQYHTLVQNGFAPPWEEGRHVTLPELEQLVIKYRNMQSAQFNEYMALWHPLYIHGFAPKVDASLSFLEVRKIVEKARARQLAFIERTLA